VLGGELLGDEPIDNTSVALEVAAINLRVDEIYQPR